MTSLYEKVALGENYFEKLDRKIQMEDKENLHLENTSIYILYKFGKYRDF